MKDEAAPVSDQVVGISCLSGSFMFRLGWGSFLMSSNEMSDSRFHFCENLHAFSGSNVAEISS